MLPLRFEPGGVLLTNTDSSMAALVCSSFGKIPALVGSRRHELTSPGCWALPANIPWTIHPGTRQPAVVFFPSVLSGLSGFPEKSLITLLDDFAAGSDLISFPLCTEDAALVEHHFARIGSEMERRQPGFRSTVTASLVDVFVLLLRSRGNTHVTTGTAHWQIDHLILAIQKDCTREFSLPRLAAQFNISPAYLSRIFSERTGIPLFEYINSQRIQKACSLLRHGNEPVLEIAYAVGYNNISFFNRYFRKLMGCSPVEYRKRMNE